MRLHLPKIYPITDTRLSGLSHSEQVARLIFGGATLIQLRDKHAAPRDFYHAAKSALSIAREHRVRLIINDRVDVALALKADGVHLGQSDISADAARHLLGEDAIIGVSTHSITQAKLASTMPINYVGFGPIFKTETKENPDPVAGLDALRSVRAALGSLPLVAIGGITPTNAREVFKAGADSVATIAGVLADPSKIAENTRRMLAEAQDSGLFRWV
ncbi:MAG TPA: thiamine phosphate synthase [Pyrinomonadaceae bacterium]|nr:thiamine phosphate synthase [Pyrinomonadaceae bacterium]